MDVMTAMKISASALKAERTRLNITSMNMANANTTRTMEGGPYRAKSVVFQAKPLQDEFHRALTGADARLRQVEVAKITEDKTPFKEIYDPTHPDADENGIVKMPNVNVAEQMVDMLDARRAYEANVAAIEAAKSMAMKALEIGR